jgi:hypothetical protein
MELAEAAEQRTSQIYFRNSGKFTSESFRKPVSRATPSVISRIITEAFMTVKGRPLK